MLKTRKRIIIAAAVVAVILAIAIVQAIHKRSAQASTADAVSSVVEFAPDDLTTVSRRTLSETLPLTGSLRAVTQAAVKSKVAGSALEVAVREGDTVKAGQILAQDRCERLRGARRAEPRPDGGHGRPARHRQTDARQQPRAGRQGLHFEDRVRYRAKPVRNRPRESRRGAAALASSNLSLGRYRRALAARRTGRVALVEPGENVAVDTKLFDVVDLRRIELEAPVPVGDSAACASASRCASRSTASTRRVHGADHARQSGRAGRARVRSWSTCSWQSAARCGSACSARHDRRGPPRTLALPLSAVRTDGTRHASMRWSSGKLRAAASRPARRGHADGDTWTAISGAIDGARPADRAGTVSARCATAAPCTWCSPRSRRRPAAAAAHR